MWCCVGVTVSCVNRTFQFACVSDKLLISVTRITQREGKGEQIHKLIVKHEQEPSLPHPCICKFSCHTQTHISIFFRHYVLVEFRTPRDRWIMKWHMVLGILWRKMSNYRRNWFCCWTNKKQIHGRTVSKDIKSRLVNNHLRFV